MVVAVFVAVFVVIFVVVVDVDIVVIQKSLKIYSRY